MNDPNEHYRKLLGLDDSWIVDDVDLDMQGQQVVIKLLRASGWTNLLGFLAQDS